MADNLSHRVNRKDLKAFITNAVTEIDTTHSEAQIPISSDASVEDARDWVNDECQL